MTKYLCLSIALLATLFSFAQTDITGAVELALQEKKPLIIFSSWFW
jgi:hypothetical protein